MLRKVTKYITLISLYPILFPCYLSLFLILISLFMPFSYSPLLFSPDFTRLDSTLGDFIEMQWTRGDISFIYNGENESNSDALSIVALDNKKNVYQRLSLNSGVNEWMNGWMDGWMDEN